MTIVPDHERLRQEAITLYQLEGEERDPEFNAITELAAELFDVPIALVTVLSSERQWFRGSCGLPSSGTKREDAFCNRTVEREDVFVVEDAANDLDYADNPLVTGEPFIRFYAGAPIKIGTGVAIGSLCVIDRQPRRFDARDSKRLAMLARTVADVIELRIGSRIAEERKNSLQRQSELLRATVDHVQQGIGVFDSDLRLVVWNDRLTELLRLPAGVCREGCTAEELLLIAAQDGTFGSGDAQTAVDALMQSIRTTPSRRLDLHMPDGRILDAWRAAIQGGRSILTIQDVTDQRHVLRMKDEFISTVSHELRTPLTSIRGALAILSRTAGDRLDARSEQMLAMAGKNADRLTRLINDILDIEKLGAGTMSMSQEQLDLGEILLDTVEQTRPFAESHGASFRLEITDEPLIVIGDAGRLQQAIANLLSNACKYSPKGGVVTVSGERTGSVARLSVRDCGPGIPVEFRPHIFGRFAQAGPEHQQGRPGSGLGLAITKAIVERHDGEIGFESEIGLGSCFWIQVPLRED